MGFRLSFNLDPLEMFRQITPNGDVSRSPATAGNLSAQIDEEEKPVPVKQNTKANVSNLVVSTIVSFIIHPWSCY